MSDASRSDLAHLYRRAGFGATAGELDVAEIAGYDATVKALLSTPAADPGAAATPPPAFEVSMPPGKNATADARKRYQQQVAADGRDLALWWLDRMVVASNPFTEKVTFFWHGHFATSIQKVRSAALMLRQNQLFRDRGLGPFDELDLAVAQDPAMMIWLDTNLDVKAHANENFARENMELFTLGYGNYSENDVREAARCYTGWRYDRTTDAFVEVARLHDNGTKTVLGHSGNLDGTDLIRLLAHSQASHRWVSARVWSRFAKTITYDPVLSELMAAYAPALDLHALFRATFLSPSFTSTKGELVKQPVEYIVGALRALHVRPKTAKYLGVLRSLGQVPFAPPNVGGWPADAAWLSTTASMTRLQFASAIARVGDISMVADAAASSRLDAVARLLSVDGWGAQSRVALAQVADDPEALVALALCAPEYVVN